MKQRKYQSEWGKVGDNKRSAFIDRSLSLFVAAISKTTVLKFDNYLSWSFDSRRNDKPGVFSSNLTTDSPAKPAISLYSSSFNRTSLPLGALLLHELQSRHRDLRECPLFLFFTLFALRQYNLVYMEQGAINNAL